MADLRNLDSMYSGWKLSVATYLHNKYNYHVPPAGGSIDETWGKAANDFWCADTTAYAVVDYLDDRARKDGRENTDAGSHIIGAEGWNEQKTFDLADTAFNLAKFAKEAGVKEYHDPVKEYVKSVAYSSAPDFFDRIPEFQDMSFKLENGNFISGKELLGNELLKKRNAPKRDREGGELSP